MFLSRACRTSHVILKIGLLCLAVLAGTVREAAATDCLDQPRLRQPVDVERDLARVEQISKSLVGQAKKEVCQAFQMFDFDRLEAQFAEDGRFARVPSGTAAMEKGTVIESAGGRGLNIEGNGCYAGARGWRADLERLLDDAIRIDRCSLKPYRILAGKPPVSNVSDTPLFIAYDLELGWVEQDGSRQIEHWRGEAELLGEAASGWRFHALTIDLRQRFEAPGPAFRDQTLQAGLPTDWTDEGYDVEDIAHGQILYGGVAVHDFDADGWPDVYLLRSGENILLRNAGDGTFVDVTASYGVGDPGNSQAAIWADFDNDGDADLFVVNAWYSLVGGPHSRRGHVIYRNDGGQFTALADPLGPIGPASGAAAADYDGDGLLDVYVTYYQDKNLNPYHHYIEARDGLSNRLYRNVGGLNFVDETASAQVGGSGWSYGAAWADADDDGHPDLYVANDYGDNAFYRNLGDGRFVEITAASGAVDAANGMSVDWGDYDNDGRLDLYISNMYSKTGRQFLQLYQGLDQELTRKLRFSAEGNSLYRNLGGGRFAERARRLGTAKAGWAWGANFFDYDNDGWLDLHVANGFWAGKLEADA